VIPAGPVTWAPGFGPNGVVAAVQTTPTTIVTGGGVVLGVQNLPSTSSQSRDLSALVFFGLILIGIGSGLLRRKPVSRMN
jgi:dipeptide/tripeptide permease